MNTDLSMSHAILHRYLRDAIVARRRELEFERYRNERDFFDFCGELIATFAGYWGRFTFWLPMPMIAFLLFKWFYALFGVDVTNLF